MGKLKQHYFHLFEDPMEGKGWHLPRKENSMKLSKAWRTISTKVVGVTFDNRQELIARLTIDTKIKLVRDPENPYDSNAIKVVTGTTCEQIGFIKRELAAELALLMDKGYDAKASISALTGEGQEALGVNILIGIYHASPTPPDHHASPSHPVSSQPVSEKKEESKKGQLELPIPVQASCYKG